MERKILSPDALAEGILGLDGWSVSDACLTKRAAFANFAAALEYVNAVGKLADEADHHPDIKLGWGYAEVSLTTHDRGGVTDVDLSLARAIDALSFPPS